MGKKTYVKLCYEDITKVLNLLEYLRSKEDCVEGTDTKPDVETRTCLAKSYMSITKDCLASHRFKSATQLLEILSLENNVVDDFMLLAGLQVLENSHSSPEEFIFYFVRHVIFLKKVYKREVLLEYAMFCLKNNVSAQNCNISTLSALKRSLLQSNIIDPLLDAYEGIFDYIDWAKHVKIQPQSELVLSSAAKVQETFIKVIRRPGQWDIFVVKLIEILEFYEKFEEAETILATYIDMNPCHINSYMYMFYFLHKYNRNTEQQLTCLREIMKRNPADEHVFYLIEILKEQPNCIEKSLRYMFMFLDYPTHKNNERAWRTLARLVVEVWEVLVPTQVNVMNACWRERASFWKRMYFSARNCSVDSKKYGKVAVQKAIVLSAFEGNHIFIQKVLTELSTKYEKLHSKLCLELEHLQQVKDQ